MKHVQNELFFSVCDMALYCRHIADIWKVITRNGRVSAYSNFVHVHHLFIVMMDRILKAECHDIRSYFKSLKDVFKSMET